MMIKSMIIYKKQKDKLKEEQDQNLKDNKRINGELQNLKKELDISQKNTNEKSNAAGNLKGLLASQIKVLEKNLKELLKISSIEELGESGEKIQAFSGELKKELSKLEEEYKAEEARFEEKKNLENQIPELEEELENSKRNLTSQNNLLIQIQANIKNCKTNLESTSSLLKYKTKEQADQRIASLVKEIAEIEKSFEAAQKNLSECQNKIAGLEAKEKENEKFAAEKKDNSFGSQIRSYVFMPYTLAKDHRTGFENGNIGAVMDGDLEGFINAYLKCSATGEWAK